MKRPDLPFVTIVEYPPVPTEPLQDAWQVACYPELTGKLAASGITLPPNASHYESFAAAFPLLQNEMSFHLKCKRLGVRVSGDPPAVWQAISECLIQHPISDRAFRYGSDCGFSVFCCRIDRAFDPKKEEPAPQAIHRELHTLAQRGVRIIDIPFGAIPFFALPQFPAQPDELHKKHCAGRTLSETEERIRRTDWYVRICLECRNLGIRVRFLSGREPVRNTFALHTGQQVSLPLPCGNYSDLAQLYDVLSLLSALPVTMICPADARDYQSAVAISSAFPDVRIGLRPRDIPSCLSLLSPSNTVLLQDGDCPAVMDPHHRAYARAHGAHEAIFYRNIVSFLK